MSVVGVVMNGGPSGSLRTLGLPADIALAPFAARFCVSDFSRTTLWNSGIRAVDPGADPDQPTGPPATRPDRLRSALRLAARSACEEAGTPIVVLVADHILDADLRPALRRHAAAGAELGLLCIPGAGAGDFLLDLAGDGVVARVRRGAGPTEPTESAAWSGDLVVRAGSLARLLATLEGDPSADDATVIDVLARRHRVVAVDLLAVDPGERRPYWHDPSVIEAYYGAQMDLCTRSPRLDLYDPEWPLRGSSDGLPPAKIVSGESSHAGHVLDTLLGDGAVIRGGTVVRSVVGRRVLVEVGAEIEDSLLLEGCRVGRGARVRRAIVGAGAVIADGQEVGYDASVEPAASRRLDCGLTLVLPGPPAR